MTNNPFDYLQFLGEVSVTLLGFVAIFLVLSNREGRFSAADRHFVQAMVVPGAITVVAAVLPSVLSFVLAGAAIWHTAAAIVIVVGLVASAIQMRAQLAMPEEEAASIHWGWHVIAWGMGLVSLLFLLAGWAGLANRGGGITV